MDSSRVGEVLCQRGKQVRKQLVVRIPTHHSRGKSRDREECSTRVTAPSTNNDAKIFGVVLVLLELGCLEDRTLLHYKVCSRFRPPNEVRSAWPVQVVLLVTKIK